MVKVDANHSLSTHITTIFAMSAMKPGNQSVLEDSTISFRGGQGKIHALINWGSTWMVLTRSTEGWNCRIRTREDANCFFLLSSVLKGEYQCLLVVLLWNTSDTQWLAVFIMHRFPLNLYKVSEGFWILVEFRPQKNFRGGKGVITSWKALSSQITMCSLHLHFQENLSPRLKLKAVCRHSLGHLTLSFHRSAQWLAVWWAVSLNSNLSHKLTRSALTKPRASLRNHSCTCNTGVVITKQPCKAVAIGFLSSSQQFTMKDSLKTMPFQTMEVDLWLHHAKHPHQHSAVPPQDIAFNCLKLEQNIWSQFVSVTKLV